MASPATFLARRLPFYYGWLVVLVAFLTLGLGANIRTSFSLLFPPILKEFGWDRATTASVFSMGFLSAALYAPLIGWALDRFGPHVVLPVGMVLVSSGLVLTTMATEQWHFFLTLGGLVTGASTILAYNSHFVFLPAWFEKKRGLAIGIACTGVGAISIALFPWLQHTIDTAGWRAGCWFLATVLIVVLFPLNLLLQRRRPEDVGLLPDGASPDGLGGGGAVSSTASLDGIDWTLGRAMRSGAFWWVGGAFFTALFVWYAILVHQTKYLLDLGYDSTLAAFALGMVPLFGIVGQVGLGALSDRIGREWIWTFGCLGFAACYVILVMMEGARSAWLVWVMVVAQGGLGYSIVSVYGAIAADIFQGRRYGLIFGTLAVIGAMGAAAGPFVLGQMFETTGSYRGAFWLSAGLSLLSIVFVWLAGPTRRRRRSVALATETVREVATIEEVRVNPVGTGAARMPSQTAPTYQFASVTPVLGCRDYLRARSFYRDALGFRVLAETGAPPRSGSLERNGFVVYLDGWQGARSHLPRLWSLYVRVRGLEQLYADLVRLGVVVSMPPTRTPQGTLELEIVDPEGNVICFSEEAGTGERPGSYGTRS